MIDSIRYLNFYELALLSKSLGTANACKMVMSRTRGPVKMTVEKATAEKMKMLPRSEWVSVSLPSSKTNTAHSSSAQDKSRKQKTVKKGSLKPSKPLSDEQKEKIFGKPRESSASPQKTQNSESPKKKNKMTKKKPNKGKAPNAIRKSKKPSRL
ncbi:Oidioi.mRNA.OKI2018_I69.PAR.g12598.t1.cds [Oikopleura dioica]|uniref:Oidioi.mRNA.OKI2018_I69.PAR.g12598.t1.cds n=1 Tax=Oikopleura dioica TaxID=34765 RepID=A0ABN7S5J1_OIKDI|nr:Oidioi.mRNA.OKI2018_I69.PAR.g12598.t1.cds [Oikopleura dioica]